MDFNQLRIFLAVLEHGSFSRAAEDLRIGQSTISFHIKALEDAVGARLLDREGRRVQPTATGRVLKRYAQRLTGLHDEALSSVRREESGEIGHLTVAASTIPAEYLLPPVLAKFRAAHPGVSLSLEVSDSSAAVASLLAQDCDLALVGARTRDSRIVYSAFADDEVVLVGPSPNPFAPSLRLNAGQLARVPLILREPGSGTRQTVERLLPAAAVGKPGAPATIRVGSSEAAKQCARRGLGLAFISRRAVTEELRAGQLTQVSAPGLPVKRQFHAARLRNHTLPAPARELLRLLHQVFR